MRSDDEVVVVVPRLAWRRAPLRAGVRAPSARLTIKSVDGYPAGGSPSPACNGSGE